MSDICTKLDLVCDEMYKDQEGFITLIVGEVLPDTVEYQKGLRFFDGGGIMYRPDGSCVHPAFALCELVAEATPQEITSFHSHSEIIDLEMAAACFDRFVPTSHPDFRRSLLGRYVNRMGLIVTNNIDRFDLMGRKYPQQRSMRDIVFRIR